MKISFTLTLNINEIIYDLQNKTYLTGRSLKNKENEEPVAYMQLDDSDTDMNNAIRDIVSSFASLKSVLAEYIANAEDIPVMGNDILPDSKDNLEVMLLFTQNINTNCYDDIISSAHDYIIYNCLSKWFEITNKSLSKDYETYANECVNRINNSINERIRPERK